jgi:hypothetical protein
LLAGVAEALTRKAVELALVGDPTAMGLCVERILPPCRERTVKFALPPIESGADITPAMKAVTSALAGGVITPGEVSTIAAVVDIFVRAIDTSDFESRPTAPTTRTPYPACTARPGSLLQPIGEILLQIRCRWRSMKQSIQFMIAVCPTPALSMAKTCRRS